MRIPNLIGLSSPNPQCPKCKSYMFMPRELDGVYYRLCKDCGFKGQPKRSFAEKLSALRNYLERYAFWKS